MHMTTHKPAGPKSADYRPLLGSRLREIMERKGITQKQLEADSGVPQSNLSAIIGGKQGVSVERLNKLALALGVSQEELTGPPVAPPVHASVQQGEKPEMSDAPAKMLPGLAEFLEREADDITNWERRKLLGVKFSVEPGEIYDHEFWADTLATFRSKRARDAARGKGGRGDA